MLIRFSCKNFTSFKDEVELCMIPSLERSHPGQIYQFEKGRVLRSAIIYGANASGKSNLVKAMSYAKKLIVIGRSPKAELDLPRFKLDKESLKNDGRFEFEILIKDEMYAYGFELNNNNITEEWLYQINKASDKLIFERKNKDKVKVKDKDVFKFGSSINKLKADDKKRIEFVAKGTRPNQLFLSQSVDQNLDNFEYIYNWFRKTLKILSPSSSSSDLEFQIDKDSQFKEYIENVLDIADTGICEIRRQHSKLGEVSSIPKDLLDSIKEQIEDEESVMLRSPEGGRIILEKKEGELVTSKLLTIHKCEEGTNDITFDLEEESDGTNRLIDLTPAFYEMAHSEQESVYVIDEMDRSMHPLVTRLLVSEHLESQKNLKSQLILTTHETSLLDTSLIRRDEIWFIQKDDNGSSRLYSLNDYKPRHDKDIEKDYILGRYGAIPFVGDFRKLNK